MLINIITYCIFATEIGYGVCLCPWTGLQLAMVAIAIIAIAIVKSGLYPLVFIDGGRALQQTWRWRILCHLEFHVMMPHERGRELAGLAELTPLIADDSQYALPQFNPLPHHSHARNEPY